MIDVILVVILLAILGGAGFYVYRAKKSGRKCIGCPEGSCPHAGTPGCTCGRK